MSARATERIRRRVTRAKPASPIPARRVGPAQPDQNSPVWTVVTFGTTAAAGTSGAAAGVTGVDEGLVMTAGVADVKEPEALTSPRCTTMLPPSRLRSKMPECAVAELPSEDIVVPPPKT